MKMSSTIGALAGALAKAQGQIRAAKKDSSNPYYHSKYADLSSVIDAIRKPMADNGLCYVQSSRVAEATKTVLISTLVAHESGEFIEFDDLELPASRWVKERNGVVFDAQSIGSAISYGRRYALSTALSIASEDDDGNTVRDEYPAEKQPKPSNSARVQQAAKKSIEPQKPEEAAFWWNSTAGHFKAGDRIVDIPTETLKEILPLLEVQAIEGSSKDWQRMAVLFGAAKARVEQAGES